MCYAFIGENILIDISPLVISTGMLLEFAFSFVNFLLKWSQEFMMQFDPVDLFQSLRPKSHVNKHILRYAEY